MKRLKSFLSESAAVQEALLGGEKYRGRPNPNKIKGSEAKRVSYYGDDGGDPDPSDHHYRQVGRAKGVSQKIPGKREAGDAHSVHVTHTRWKGKDVTHVSTEGEAYNDEYMLKGRVSPEKAAKHYKRTRSKDF